MTRVVNITYASAITPKPVLWLMDQRVPLGKLTVLAGRPGLGKSLFTTTLAADVTNGAAAGDLLHTASRVLLVSAEDDPEDTIVPRLMAANADLALVGFLDLTQTDESGAVVPGTIALPGDVPGIAEHVKATGARLIVVDPIAGYLDGQHSAYSNQEVRRALGPLAQLARDEHCAVIAVMHLNKSASTDPLGRIADSAAFTALARSVLLLGADPDDPEGDDGNRRVLTIAKGNLKERGAHGITLAVEPCTVTDPDGLPIATARLAVTGTSTASAEDVLCGSDARSAGEEARRFIEAELAGGPVPAKDMHIAAEAAGISASTLERIKRKIGIRSKKQGGGGPWRWHLPDHLDHLGRLGQHDQEPQEHQQHQDPSWDAQATTRTAFEHSALIDDLVIAFDATEIAQAPERAVDIDLRQRAS